MYYIVFGSVKRPLGGGGSYLDWSSVDNPIGVFEAEAPDQACQLAAAETQSIGNFFAVEGVPWGIDMMTTTGRRFGNRDSAMERLNKRLDQMEDLDNRIAELRALQEKTPYTDQ